MSSLGTLGRNYHGLTKMRYKLHVAGKFTPILRGLLYHTRTPPPWKGAVIDQVSPQFDMPQQLLDGNGLNRSHAVRLLPNVPAGAHRLGIELFKCLRTELTLQAVESLRNLIAGNKQPCCIKLARSDTWE